jgi:hypothetical protein
MGQIRRVGADERRARLAVRHHLTTEHLARGTDLARLAEDLIALHGTDSASVYLAAWARVADLSLAQVEQALYAEGVLVRMLGMRRTVFVVPADLGPVIQSACTDQVAARLRRALIQVVEEAGIAVDGDGWLRDVSRSVLAALTARGSGTGAELARDEPRLRTRIIVAEGKSYGGEASLTSRILNLISAEGLIVRGRPRGGWTSTQYEWVPAATWLQTHVEPLPAGAARVDLAQRWLRAFGPAPVSDLQWWTGWTAGQVKETLRQLDIVDADLDGCPGIMLAKDDFAATPAEPWVALLPALDPTAMGWQNRDWFLGPHREALFDRSGNIGPTIWWDGRIIGGWAQRADGDIVTRLLEDVGADAGRAIQSKADRLRSWLGPLRFVPKFRTPLERELSA